MSDNHDPEAFAEPTCPCGSTTSGLAWKDRQFRRSKNGSNLANKRAKL